MMASTIDGKIAKNANHFANWTSQADKKFFSQVSRKLKVVIMGENTFKTFPKPLPGRLNVVFSHQDNQEIEGVKWVKGEPKKVLEDLERLGYKSALLGGGAKINSLFLDNKLIDEIIISFEAKIFGTGLSIFAREHELDLKLLELKKLNDDVFFARYKVIY